MSAAATSRVEGVMSGDLDVKRFYLPGVVIHSQCPKCGAEYARDMADSYLSYPTAGEPFAYGCYCAREGCEHEWEMMMRIDVTLSVVTP